MASTESSATSEDPNPAAVMSVQQSPGHPQNQTDMSQDRDTTTESIIQRPSKDHRSGGLMPVCGPQDQVSSEPSEECHTPRFFEDSVDISGPQCQGHSALTQDAITRRSAEVSMYAPEAKPHDGSLPTEDTLAGELAVKSASRHFPEPHVGSQPTQLTQKHQRASISMNTDLIQPQLGSQKTEEHDNHQRLARTLMDDHQGLPQKDSFKSQDVRNLHFPYMPKSTHRFQPQNWFRRNQQGIHREVPPGSIGSSQPRQEIDIESHNRRWAQMSMNTSRLQPQILMEQIQEAHNRHLAEISMNCPECNPQTEFPQTREASISQLGQIPVDLPAYRPRPDLLRSAEVHDRQSNQIPMSARRPRGLLDFPLTEEALRLQMALIAERDAQAGPRPPLWGHGRQNFGIFESIPATPPANTMLSCPGIRTTNFPQEQKDMKSHFSHEMVVGSPGQSGPQQFDAPHGWPSFCNQGTLVDPHIAHRQIVKTSDMLWPATTQTYVEPAVCPPLHSQSHREQPQMPPAPIPVGGMRPATVQMLPKTVMPSSHISEKQGPWGLVHRATSNFPHPKSQPPIGTPRASAPKLVAPIMERSSRRWPQALVGPTVPLLPYHPGSDVMYPYTKESPSEALRVLTANGRPSIEKLSDTAIVPFAMCSRDMEGSGWGVVRIGNIPYSITRADVVNFLGGSAHVVPPEHGTGIHIVMDRTTGKTMDCYVEYLSVNEAQNAVNRLVYRGPPLRLGSPPQDRVVRVAMSSQDELMKQLFPRAKNVTWTDGKPVIHASNEPFNTGFKTFITGEELVMMTKHAEQPHRSSYTQKCPQRTYECMISTLAKFPWYAGEHYTLGTREQIFIATRDMLKHLVVFLKRGGLPNLDYNLLLELMITGLNAKGFSERQRWELIQAAEYTGQGIRISPLAQFWPWQVLGRRAGTEEDVVQYYAHLMTLHPTLQATVADTQEETPNPFGGSVLHGSLDLTIAEAGALEWELFQGILRDVLRATQKE